MINPFRQSIVTDPWNIGNVDVREINAGAFELCCRALDRVRAEGRCASVLVHGEAGSGKTHLLGRLRSYIRSQSQLCIFVAVSLHTSPNRLWRHIREGFVESLLRSIKRNRSQLDFIFMRRLFLHSQKKYLTVDQLRRDIDELSVEAELTWNLSKVIEHFVRRRHRREAFAWLKGTSLPSEVLETIGLAPQQDEVDDPEEQARGIINELCRLAGPTIPVVICFDKVEALQRYPRDEHGLMALGRVIRSLHETADNVLMVSCLQSLFLEQLKKTISQADYATLAHDETTLNPLTFEQSMKLVKARIDNCDGESETRASLYARFEKQLKEVVWMKKGRTARDVLGRCAAMFDAWETSESIAEIYPDSKQTDAEFLTDEITNRQEQAIRQQRPEQMEAVFQNAVPVLIHILDDSWSEQDQQRPPDVDMVLKNSNSKVAISFCNQQNLRSLAGRFKRLGSQLDKTAFDKLFLIRHPELPINLGAKKTRKYLAELKRLNAIFFTPDIQLMAALETLWRIVADAKAGDLVNSGRAVSSGAVIDWLKENMVIPVAEFLNQIMDDETTIMGEDFEILQDLHSLLEDQPIMKLVDAAVQLAIEPGRLQVVAREYPGQIGFLQGPPPVIFQFIPQSVQR